MKYIEQRNPESQKILDAHIAYEEGLEEALKREQTNNIILPERELNILWEQMQHSIGNIIMPSLLHRNDTKMPIPPSPEQIKKAFKWAVIRFEQNYKAEISEHTGNRIFNGSYLANATAYKNLIGDISFGRAMEEYFRRVIPGTIGLDNQIDKALLIADNEWFRTPENERNILFELLKSHFQTSPSLSQQFQMFQNGELSLDHALKYILARMEAPDMLNVRDSKSSNRPYYTGRTIKNNPFTPNVSQPYQEAYTLDANNYYSALTAGAGTFPTLGEFLLEYQTEVIRKRPHLKQNIHTGHHQ